ncbi:MAG: potassium-transporting ATPase subunit KdpA [Planctomycetes bacterium]|nr:potassium-transporting ATPase subunit KdpA [Planctomycetota bacterium]
MSLVDGLRIVLPLLVLAVLAVPVGTWIARVFGFVPGESSWTERVFGPLERLVLRVARVDATRESGWRRYALDVLVFHGVGVLALYAILRTQGLLPFDDRGLDGMSPDLAFDTAVSFVTNTNWQSYAGETTLTIVTQTVGLAVQNFVSAAAGLAIAIALFRGIARKGAATVGNFPADLIKATVQVLLPLSLGIAIVLVGQGVPQTFASGFVATPIEGDGTTNFVPVGPVASQIAIKQLGTNGGGFFNANAAHPFENPTPLSNLIEWMAMLLLPFALCFTFGKAVADTRQGRAIFAAMAILFALSLSGALAAEWRVNPAVAGLAVDTTHSDDAVGGNTEGKEVRFGTIDSVSWAIATTSASCGAVNAMHDSLMPLAGLVPLWLIQVGEVVFGGVGAGIYGMLLFVVLGVFIGGLMVGRTPEYLGKKLDAFETKMATLGILLPPVAILVGTALAVSVDAGRAAVANPGAHGFGEILYAFSSASGNNGSAFCGLSANVPFFNLALGLCMLVGRFGVILPVLAIAGSLAAKKRGAASLGTLPTHGSLFVVFLVAIVLLVGALTYLPALLLGPIVEHIDLVGSAAANGGGS